jgi:type IV secretion system protein TrbL
MMQAAAQIPDVSGTVLEMYNSMRPAWLAAVMPWANRLFWSLAIIDMVWAAIKWWGARLEIEEWTAQLLQKIIIIGAFYALLINGPEWVNAIIVSLQEVGKQGSGVPTLSPGDVLMRGFNIAGNITASAGYAAFFKDAAAALMVIVASWIVLLSFGFLAISMLTLQIEAFCVLTGGMIFLGFGGVSWTRPYVERFMALSVAIGVKLMLLYFLIGVGSVETARWLEMAKNLHQAQIPAMQLNAIALWSLMYFAICWHIPKWFGSLLSSAPSMTAGDTIQAASLLSGGAIFNMKRMMAHAAAMTASRATGGSSNGHSGGYGRSYGNGATSNPGAGTPRRVSAPGRTNGGGNGR